MKAKTEHEQRVREELPAVGVTGYGLLKGASRKLPGIIHPDDGDWIIPMRRMEKTL